MRQRVHSGAQDQATDGELACLAAAGDPEAFECLYRRHVEAAWRVALAVTCNPDDAADAVSDAFVRVLQALPERLSASDHFLPYLLAAVRNAAIDLLRRGGRQRSAGAEDAHDWSVLGSEPAELVMAGTDATLIATAFRSLPQRWRSVLWLTEVEGIPAREVAGLLGVSANGVAQLAVRARAGLRQRYLQAHLRQSEVRRLCQDTVARLGAYAAGALAPRDISKVDQHLAGCETCRSRLEQLEDLVPSLRRAVLPLPAGLGALVVGKWRMASTGASGAPPATVTTAASSATGASSATVAGATAPAGIGLGAAAVAIPASFAASFASVALLVAGIVGVGVVQHRRSEAPAAVAAAPDASFRTAAASPDDGAPLPAGGAPGPAPKGVRTVRSPDFALAPAVPGSLPTAVPEVTPPAPPPVDGIVPGDLGVDVNSLPVGAEVDHDGDLCFTIRVLGAHLRCETVTAISPQAPDAATTAAGVASAAKGAATEAESLVGATTDALSRLAADALAGLTGGGDPSNAPAPQRASPPAASGG